MEMPETHWKNFSVNNSEGNMTAFTFSKVDKNGRILAFWDPEVGGQHAEDCKIGRTYADEVVERMIRDTNPAILGWVVGSFNTDESFKSAEIGFCARIAELLLQN